jgi:PhnB protein
MDSYRAAASRQNHFMNVKAIPSGYSSVTPYLIVEGATAAIEFYKQVFGATERMRLPLPDGKIAHAEIQIGDSVIMLADPPTGPTAGRSKSPTALDGTAVSIHLYIEDVDSVMEKATKAGAKQVRAVANQFYGDRSGIFTDPFGHVWNVATHIEDLSPEEMEKRMAELS